MSNAKAKAVIHVPADLRDIFPGFLENRKREVLEIPNALLAGDFERIRIWGHNMAGSGAGYGFPAISELGRCLENAAMKKQGKSVAFFTKKLAHLVNHTEVVFCE